MLMKTKKGLFLIKNVPVLHDERALFFEKIRSIACK